jgi:hypothetical protein
MRLPRRESVWLRTTRTISGVNPTKEVSTGELKGTAGSVHLPSYLGRLVLGNYREELA